MLLDCKEYKLHVYVLQRTSIGKIYFIFYINNACGSCALLYSVLLACGSFNHTRRFYSVVCYSCVALTFSFEWKLE